MADESDYESQSEIDLALSAHAGPSTSGAPAATSATAKGKATKPKPKRSTKASDQDIKRRSSKACDNCRKQKSKCARILDPATQDPIGACQNCLTAGLECTFSAATRKRGPPKGYIEAIESRLHRMEALLGGILQNDDPRAQALLGELIGDEDSRDMLARDLKAANKSTKPEKSWKREFALQQEAQALQEKRKRQESALPSPSTSFALPGQTGDPSAATATPAFSSGFSQSLDLLTGPATGSGWFNEEDLGFDAAGLAFGQSPPPVPPSGPPSGFAAIDFGTASAQPSYTSVSSMAIPSPMPQHSPALLSTSLPSNTVPGSSSSPRQRRRTDANSPAIGTDERRQMAYSFTLPGQTGPIQSSTASSKSAPGISFTKTGPMLPKGAIGHTGQSTYTLSTSPSSTFSPRPRSNTSTSTTGGTGFGGSGLPGDGSESRDGENDSWAAALGSNSSPVEARGSSVPTSQATSVPQGGPEDELADVVGQLSINENEEVRYHGRSSGLYLISKSQRFRDFFWQFPSAGVWPKSEARVAQTERQILGLAEGEDHLPDLETQHHLLQAYWTYVHPHFPILYKVSFMRQYRHSLAHSSADTVGSPSSSFGHGPVPSVLLLSMFALSARYCDLYSNSGEGGNLWDAGEEFLQNARKILNHEYGSSRLVMVQALLLIAYREIGVGAMSSAWMAGGMAIRMAQDLGLFRDADKWFLPVQRFSHEEKQTRKRIWWGCIIMDRYTSSYIGRPGAIHERDYDTGFCSEDEPDEHEQWRPIRLDGTDYHSPAKNPESQFPEEITKVLKAYPTTRAHTLSCYNAKAALAVIINRIISNIYAIRIRVLGQSSETLLSLLDQSLASWFLALPPHLSYNPASSDVPAPHILSLHLQFYSSLILLHRPFIPGQNSSQSPGSFPSHSICTTSANAIATIVTAWRKTFTLRQCPPFVTYPVFSAAIICVYNASFDEALARPAKLHLLQLMNALKDMEMQWGSAIRAFELLHGLVDLRDAELNAELAGLAAKGEGRGTKRATMEVDEKPTSEAFATARRTNFHSNARPIVGRAGSTTAKKRQNSMNASMAPPAAMPQPHSAPLPVFAAASPENWHAQSNLPSPGPSHDVPTLGDNTHSMFSHHPPELATPVHHQQQPGLSAQTFDILNPSLDLSQFRSPPGTSAGPANFSDLLNSFMSPTEAAGLPGQFSLPSVSPPNQQAAGTAFDSSSAFFGMPLGAVDEWYGYSLNAFGTGGTPGSGPTVAGSASPEAMQTNVPSFDALELAPVASPTALAVTFDSLEPAADPVNDPQQHLEPRSSHIEPDPRLPRQ
ncbi:uncharacterized protein JCM15063_002694 [Sporobolomyces koalae]|uniref:uncharacterized protein n=1 Tax=Sporobolomyces koalae TaxID=500713 RepID=UPI00316F846A